MKRNLRARENSIIDLRERLELPSSLVLTDTELISYIRKMPRKHHATILYERYVNNKTFSEIERLYDLEPFSCSHTCKSAIKMLRRFISEQTSPKEERSINRYIHYDVLKSERLGSKSVKDVIAYLMSFDYKASTTYDFVIQSLEQNGFNIVYPKYLLKHPEFPYNLYAHILQNNGIRMRMTVKELYIQYIKQISLNPDYNLTAFLMHQDIIFSDKNEYLTNRQKIIAEYYYKKQLSIPAISFILGISESLIKLELRNVVKELNTDAGKYFIHYGSIK